jgi:phosphonate transport system substrate-binding protein
MHRLRFARRTAPAILSSVTLAVAAAALSTTAAQAGSADCPNNGVVRLAAIPAEDTSLLGPILGRLGALIADRLGCDVKVQFGTSYTAAIEAMRAQRAEIAMFGAFSYVLAHEVAGAEAVATYAGPDDKPGSYYASITTWPGSGIKTLQDIRGKAFAFSDPASTSGHLIPSYGLRKAGIDPDRDVRAFYTGSHTASFEALRNHKVPVGELNSVAIAGARVAGSYDEAAYLTLWQSNPIPNGPFAVRANLEPEFKARLIAVLQTLDISSMPPADMKFLGRASSHRFAAIDDHAYDGIRDVVSVLHLNLAQMKD